MHHLLHKGYGIRIINLESMISEAVEAYHSQKGKITQQNSAVPNIDILSPDDEGAAVRNTENPTITLMPSSSVESSTTFIGEEEEGKKKEKEAEKEMEREKEEVEEKIKEKEVTEETTKEDMVVDEERTDTRQSSHMAISPELFSQVSLYIY